MDVMNTNWEQFFSFMINKAINIAFVSLMFFILYQVSKKIVKHLFKKYSERPWADETRILTFSRLVQSSLQYLTVFLYIYTLLNIFGIPVGSLLAGAGLFGVALGLACRDLVTDMINGFFIIVEHQINVGDTIRFENLNLEGVVKTVGFRSITLITADGGTAFIPNRNIESLKNFSYQDRSMTLDVPVNEDNLLKTKAHILAVNEKFDSVEFVGIVTEQDRIYLRSKLTAPLDKIGDLKQKIFNAYYEN